MTMTRTEPAVQRDLDRHERAKQERGQFPTLWESVAEVLAPRRAGFISAWAAGSQRTDKLFDTAPMLNARGLATAIDGLVKPKQTQWFEIEAEDPAVMRDQHAADWFFDAERRLFKEIYNPKARWQQATGEADFDQVVFGNSFTLCTENSTRDGLLFRTTHMKDTYFLENADGMVDTVHLTEMLPVRTAAQRWGEENLGERARELIKNDRASEKLTYLQIFEPRHDRDPIRRDNLNMPYRYTVIEVASEHRVIEAGFEEFPGAAPRWDTTAGETYGRGPGTLALPSVQTCQQVKKTLLKAGHRAVDPPWVAARNLLLGPAQNRPGGLTIFDGAEASKLGSIDPIRQLDSRANLPFGLDMLRAEREEVAGAFYRNVLNLPAAGPAMTATEVNQRREEFIREIGAVFGRLETEYITPLVERAFWIVMRRSIKQNFEGPMTFKPLPDSLQGQEVRFKFSSPIDRAKRQIEATQTQEWLFRVLELAKADPGAMDNVDIDAVIRIDAEAHDIPPAVIPSKEVVEQRRQERAQQQQTQQGLALAQQGAGAAKQGADAVNALGGDPAQLLQALAAGQAGAASGDNPVGAAVSGIPEDPVANNESDAAEALRALAG